MPYMFFLMNYVDFDKTPNIQTEVSYYSALALKHVITRC